MDDLQRRVGGGQVTRLVTAQPLAAGATGEHMLVLNPSSADALDPDVLDWALGQAHAAGGKAAWLCASHSEADILQAALGALGQPVYRLRAGDDTAVDAWSRAPRGHLITAGRYDGLDFAGDICRLVIITTVPQASSEFERFVVAYLGDATFMRHRVGQRVTQALGRANRTSTDRSLYLGLDPTFAQILADPAVRASIPEGAQPTVRAALELYDQGPAAAASACRAFWQAARHPAPVNRQGRRYRAGEHALAAALAAAARSPALTPRCQQPLTCGSATTPARRAKPARPQICLPLPERPSTPHSGDTSRPTPCSTGAGPRISPPLVKRCKTQSRMAHARHGSSGLKGTAADVLAGQEKVAADGDRIFLAWDDLHREFGARLEHALAEARRQLAGGHDEQCEGLKMLARLVGAVGERPPKSEQSATDCRWSWSIDRRARRTPGVGSQDGQGDRS